MKNFTSFLITITMVLCQYTTNAQTVMVSLTQAPCNANGILTASFTGFTPPLNVDWGGTLHTGITGTTDVLTGYTGKPMWIYVTDANSQTGQTYYLGARPFDYTVSTTNAICPANGSASVTVQGGTAPYSYDWTPYGTTITVSTSNPASLPAGNYQVMITDANGCKYGSKYGPDSTGRDSITIHSTSTITFTTSSTPANCTNGTATVAGIGGGTAPYSLLWSNSASSATITGLTMGTYAATVTDATGCATTKYVTVNQSKVIGTNVTKTPATCLQSNGSMIAFGSGGQPPYSYLWSNSATTPSISGLAPGSYNVKVTDANGCFGIGYAQMTASTPINATYTTIPSSCTAPTGSASLSITGGTVPYSIQWYTMPVQTGNSATGLPQGYYPFKITDAVGCVRTGTAYIPPVNTITLNFTTTNATCTQSNGSATVTPSGGSTPYTYLWSSGNTTSSIAAKPAGNYSVKVTDNAGCSITKWTNIGVNSPVNIGFNTSPASCIFSSNGTATALPTGGTPPYSYKWGYSASTTPTINGLKTGHYGVEVTDAAGCKDLKTTYVSYNSNNNSCYCTIAGTVYNDLNNNCTQDVGEPGIPNIQIHCSGKGYTYTNSNGAYSFIVPTGVYTISETVLGYYPLAACQNNSIVVNATAAPNCTHTVNFANTVNPIRDIHIQTWDIDCAVPGYPYKQKLIIHNAGTVTESSVVSGYRSSVLLPTPVFNPGGFFTGSGPHYSISPTTLSLAPGASQSFTLNYVVPTNMPLSTGLTYRDTAAHSSAMANWLNDYSPWNNVNLFTTTVVGSFDPNLKQVRPKGTGPNGIITRNDTTLEYMVQFQNLGTYKAQNIYILDTLDADLDWATLRPVYQSHECKITMDENGVVRFQFDNINLPAEMHDEPSSHGMVTYTIKTKKGLPLGTQFKNSAAIYFDFNEPVITNTTVNTLGELSVDDVVTTGKGNVSVYPNPTHDIFSVRIHEGSYQYIKVINTLGQVYYAERLTGDETSVDMGAATPGIYFVILQGTEGSTTKKIEKL